MLLEILIGLFVGILAGCITGLIPGVHVNLISLLALTFSPKLLEYTTPLPIGVFIIAMSVTHSFLDFIPSVFLGAPDSSTALSVLPGHKLLLEGKAYEAVKLTLVGSLGSLIFCILLVPLLIPFVNFVYPILKNYVGYVLIVIVLFMIFRDKNKFWNAIIFLLSGCLGIIVLAIPNLNNPLFPMLSGLFGLSMLIVSLTQNVIIPKQIISNTIKLSKKNIFRAIFSASIAGTLTSFFPGMGPSQGAVLASELNKDMDDYGFMILVGGINTVNFVLSLITLLLLNKARNGAVIVVRELIGQISITQVLVFLSVSLVVGGIATILALNLTKIFSVVISKVNYNALVILIIVLITGLTIYFGGLLGLAILVVSTALGIVPGELGIARNHAMGCLILPVILFLI